MGKYKEKLIKEYLKKEFEVGERALIKGKFLQHNRSQDPEALNTVEISEVNEGFFIVKEEGWRGESLYTKVDKGNVIKDTLMIGASPMPEKTWRSVCRNCNYSLCHLIYKLENDLFENEKTSKYHIIDGVKVNEFNFNPYVISKDGSRKYYQRDFCWSLNDERLFIDSLYNDVDCGKVVLRKRNYRWVKNEVKNGITEVGFFDIVDGKQRLNALKRFLNDEFKDSQGFYYSDLSIYSKRLFEDKMCFSIMEIGEDATDDDVLAVFLSVNFTGKPMSKKHIDYVKSIQKGL